MKISVNPLNGKSYSIPIKINDKTKIDSFINSNPSRPVVVVQGLGFVGAVMSLVCANAINGDYSVVGVDLPREDTYWKIKSINEGLFPVVASDPKINEFFNIVKERGNFFATSDEYAYSKADIIIVDINLDVAKNSDFYGELKNYDVSLDSFKKAMESIGKNCKEDVLILIETTVPPGTTQKVAKPIIEKCLMERGLSTKKLKLGHSYERVMPGPDYIDSIQNFYRVYAGINDNSANSVESFLKTIISTKKYPLTRLGNTNATEMAKVLENSYRAMNIAFAVEWSRFAEESGVNLYEVVDAIRMRPTHNNLMYPGIGVGGYCLTKDPLLASWSKKHLFKSKDGLMQSRKGVEINDKMPFFAFQFLKRELNLKTTLDEKKVLLLGVSYRSNVGDTRYSPVEPFYDYLLKHGANVQLHDSFVKFWEEKKIDINTNLKEVLDNITELDILIITTAHEEYKSSDYLNSFLSVRKDLFILDTVGMFSNLQINELNKIHTVRVVGRGDII